MGDARPAAATIDDLLEGGDLAVTALARQLRDLILAADPEAVEVVRLGDRAATYGVGPKKMSEGYVYLMPQRGYVNLGFYRGAFLPDPGGLLEGAGRGMRHVKIRSRADVENPALGALIAGAVAERAAEVMRTTGGGRARPMMPG